MSYRVVVSARAEHDLERVPQRIVPAIIEFMFGDLAASPFRVGKPLQRELVGRFSARRGPYRVLYRVDDEQQVVVVLRIAHRSDVYRVD